MKFSIVTPSYNSEKYIREAIESVIKQKGHFSIEYIIVDKCSDDDTREIIKHYQRRLENSEVEIFCHDIKLHLVSEQDAGMYDALNKGFTMATGDIFAWINSDDIYLPGAFDIVKRTLERYPQISWLKGITSYLNENSTIHTVGHCNLYRQDLILKGLYGPVLYFIQQDSVFWRSELWKMSEGLDGKYKLAGDYFLWKEFAKHTPLYSLNAYVSCFRRHHNQASRDIEAYFSEINSHSTLDRLLFQKIGIYYTAMERLPRFLSRLCYRFLFGHQIHHLILLEGGVMPQLIEGEFFALRDIL